MNERIIKLAEQAGLEYDFNPMLWLKYEKFAELIVQECCQKLENDGMVEVAMDMKKHFGVEE